jgi:Protein of unknown function (DUF3800)
MNPIVAFDESGNTGSNLLDKSQPVFVFASVLCTDEEARELLSLIPTQSAGEKKFSRIKGNPAHWTNIEALIKHPLISADHVCLSVYHKPFGIAVHTVDRLLEEVAYRDGFDLYEGGANIGMANLLFMTMPVFCDKNSFEEYQVAFVEMFRRQTPETIYKFYAVLDRMIAICKDDQFKGILYAIKRSQMCLKDIFEACTKYTFDAALTGLFCLCDFWGKKLQTTFDIYADHSKPLQYFDDYIQLFKSSELAERELGYDRRRMTIPLKIGELSYKDSKESPRVQLADILAGAANHYFTALANPSMANGLSEMLGSTPFVTLFTLPIWPSHAVTPVELGTDGGGGDNPLDAMAEISEKSGRRVGRPK